MDGNSIDSAFGTIKKWDEMTINEQYIEGSYNENIYTSKVTEILSENIEKNTGTAIFKGYDTYTNTEHTKKGEVYIY